jgi:CHAD domain-containing protein
LSKSERGYNLINGDQSTPVKAVPVDVTAGMSAVIINEAALIKGDAEGVHQMRVGVRRMRAAMSLFSSLLRDSQTRALKIELKWLASELAPVRELDVLLERVIAPVKKQNAHVDGIRSLAQELAKRREAAIIRAQHAVKSARFRVLTLEIAAWLECGQWREPDDDLVRDRGDLSIEVFAAEQLNLRWRKIRKKGKALAQLDTKSRHRLRIQVKKLRYASEFFAKLFLTKAESNQRKFLRTLQCVQDGLGDLNDIAVHEHLISAMGQRRSNPKRAFAAGLLTGRENARFEAAMAAASEAYAELVKLKRFWR